MKLKYYLRGLGVGMLVMMLILWATGNLGAKMSDEAVKRRAAELGMVEKDQTVLSNVGGEDLPPVNGAEGQAEAQKPAEEAASEADGQEQAAAPENDGQEPAEAAAPENGGQEPPEEAAPEDNGQNQPEKTAPEDNGQNQPEAAAPEDNTQQPVEERADEAANRAEAAAQNAPAGRKLTLTVNKGDSSVTVARKAAEAGLIKSAKDFDAFLCRNGDDKKISVGNYEIAEGASEQDIADIITRRR